MSDSITPGAVVMVRIPGLEEFEAIVERVDRELVFLVGQSMPAIRAHVELVTEELEAPSDATLSGAEADSLADALELLHRLRDRWSQQSHSNAANEARVYGRLSEAADTARDVLSSMLITVEVYASSPAAGYALHRDEVTTDA